MLSTTQQKNKKIEFFRTKQFLATSLQNNVLACFAVSDFKDALQKDQVITDKGCIYCKELQNLKAIWFCICSLVGS